MYLDHYKTIEARVLASVLRGAKLCNFPPRDKIKTLKMPAMILAWAGDATHPISTAKELNELLPESQLVVASRIEEVKTWAHLIREFIKRLGA